MPSVTVENYLKQIYLLRQGRELTPMGELALAVHVTPGTATSMVKTFAEAGLVFYEPRAGVRLTDQGTTLALQVLRRHRLIELFLVEILGLDWSQVHEEAEELEHAISDKVLEQIDRILGYPDTDPHGDPIPPRTGPPNDIDLTPLTQVAPGQTVTIARIIDQAPDFLQFIDQHSLTPGTRVTLHDHDLAADAMTCEPAHAQVVTLGSAAAEKILIRP